MSKKLDLKVLTEDDAFSLYVAEDLGTGEVVHWTLREDDMRKWCEANCYSRGGEISHHIHEFRRQYS